MGGPFRLGGGIRPGVSHGETDPFGYNIARDPVHLHDFQATILHLLGIDHDINIKAGIFG